MKIMARAQGFTKEVSKACSVFEYEMLGGPMNAAVSKIEGRYPETSFVLNEACHELSFVMEGEGAIETPEGRRFLRKGDMVMISPGEPYAWDGNMTLFMVCNPPWQTSQHRAA